MSFILTLALMVTVYLLISWFKNKKTAKVIKTKHHYFSRLWLWPQGEHTRWEAEFDTSSKFANKTVALRAEDNYQSMQTAAPTAAEVEFAKHYLSNLELLFPLAFSAVQQGWKTWFKAELPQNWQKEFVVDGFSVPISGDVTGRWNITLYCNKAGHYFCLTVKNGTSRLLSIDG